MKKENKGKCACCENKSTTEVKVKINAEFCNEHGIIDLYKKQIKEAEEKMKQ